MTRALIETSNQSDMLDAYVAGKEAETAAAPPRASVARRAVIWLLIAVTVAGFVARLALSLVSIGSMDAVAWQTFGMLFLFTGPRAYEITPALNHPPIPLLWATFSIVGMVIPGLSSHFVFRLAPIAADIGSCVLLLRIWRKRKGDSLWGWLAAAAMSWNLAAFLIGSFHGNTDNVCAFFTLLTAYCLDNGKPGKAGLAMAAAINIKLSPIVVLPAIVLSLRSWSDLFKFAKMLSLGVIPFLIMWSLTPTAFYNNVLSYKPPGAQWGLLMLSSQLLSIPGLPGGAWMYVAMWYIQHGGTVMLTTVALCALLARLIPGRWSIYERGAIAWSLLIVLAPGFGAQYVVYPVPLMLAVSLGRGSTYGLAAGLFAFFGYIATWNLQFPIDACIHGAPIDRPSPMLSTMGFVAWASALSFIVWCLLRPARGERDTRPVNESAVSQAVAAAEPAA